MHATHYQHTQTPAARETTGETALSQSALSGVARLRELEHLAETARKVRDQAAGELTRNHGTTHHIARDRMAAAERMLRKTQQEIVELREQLGNSITTPVSSAQPKDFELAVMLGHSRARFNLESSPQLTLQEQHFALRNRNDERASKRSAQGASAWRTVAFGLVLSAGVGIGGLAAYGFISTGTIDGAVQAVRDGTTRIVAQLHG